MSNQFILLIEPAPTHDTNELSLLNTSHDRPRRGVSLIQQGVYPGMSNQFILLVKPAPTHDTDELSLSSSVAEAWAGSSAGGAACACVASPPRCTGLRRCYSRTVADPPWHACSPGEFVVKQRDTSCHLCLELNINHKVKLKRTWQKLF